MKKVQLNYLGRTTKEYFNNYPTYKGEYVIFKNLSNGSDFKLNQYFFKGYKIKDDILYLL